jgi:hypothetical protein
MENMMSNNYRRHGDNTNKNGISIGKAEGLE